MVSRERAYNRRLPPYRDLATNYGAARNTVRKSWDGIGAEGCVQRRARDCKCITVTANPPPPLAPKSAFPYPGLRIEAGGQAGYALDCKSM